MICVLQDQKPSSPAQNSATEVKQENSTSCSTPAAATTPAGPSLPPPGTVRYPFKKGEVSLGLQ